MAGSHKVQTTFTFLELSVDFDETPMSTHRQGSHLNTIVEQMRENSNVYDLPDQPVRSPRASPYKLKKEETNTNGLDTHNAISPIKSPNSRRLVPKQDKSQSEQTKITVQAPNNSDPKNFSRAGSKNENKVLVKG